MKELFINELRRFRNTALIAAGVHLVLLLLINQLYNVLQMPVEMYMVMLALYMLAGAGLGLYQFGSYRQPSRWIWLMHRPVPHSRIFVALTAAVATLVLLAIGLPALLIVAANDIFTARVVDMRHYLLVPHAMLFVTMAWMCGAYIMLSRSRTAFVLVIVPLWMLLHGASAFAMLAPTLLCVALLGYVVFKAVKPNRLAPPDAVASLLTVSLPLQLGFYFALLWAGSLCFQYGQMLAGVHPLNMDIDPPGGFVEASRAETPKLVELGLAASKDPRAEQWRRQVALSTGTSNSPVGSPVHYQVRHALANLQANSFDANGARYSFSHDSMLYEGADLRSGKPRGSLGMGGEMPFDSPPLKVTLNNDFSYLLLPHAVYGLLTGDTVRSWPLATFGKDEYVVSVPRTFDKRTYLLTNQRLLAYRASTDDGSPLEKLFAVSLPRQVSDLVTSDMVHLLDGTLVSLTYGQGLIDGVEGGMQIVYFIDGLGKAVEVARRTLAHDFPALFEHRSWWVSPILNLVSRLPGRLYGGNAAPDGEQFTTPFLMPRPLVAWVAALGSMLAAAAAASWWLRRSPIAPSLRYTWIASCLLLGIPAFLSLIVLQARTRPLAAAPPVIESSGPALITT
jgi:hypothetical protein